jgi:hypothetical protein
MLKGGKMENDVNLFQQIADAVSQLVFWVLSLLGLLS